MNNLALTDDELLTLCLGAFRYYLGRRTYAVSDFCNLLRNNWCLLPRRTKDLIQKELEKAFAKDDEDRLNGSEYRQLGADCDRAQWEIVRKLWSVDREQN